MTILIESRIYKGPTLLEVLIVLYKLIIRYQFCYIDEWIDRSFFRTCFLWHNSHEMYIDSFDLCGKMIELIQCCFLYSPVEFFQPMITNCLHIFTLESVLKSAIFQIVAKTCFLKSPLEVLNICIRYLDSHGFYSDVIILLFAWSPPLRLVVNRF